MSSAGVAMKRLHDALQQDQAGRSAEAIVAAREALAAFAEAADRTGQAAAHHLLASLHEERGERPEAVDHALRSAALREETGDLEGLLPLLHLLLHLHAEDPTATRAVGERLLAAYEKVSDRERVAAGLQQLAGALLAIEALDTARAAIERGLWNTDRAGEERGRSAFLQLSARLELAGGRQERAVRMAMEAVQLARQGAGRPAVADALHLLGLALQASGQPQRAAEVLEEALDLREALRDPTGRALELDALASVEVELGRERDAVDRLLYLARIWGEELGDRMQELEALHRAGEIAAIRQPDRALALARRQLERANALGAPDLIAASWHVLAGREVAAGELESAAMSFARAGRARREAGQEEAAAVAAGMLGQVLDALGRRDEATAVLAEAEATLARLGSPNLAAIRELIAER